MPTPKTFPAVGALAASAAVTSPHFIAAMPGAIRDAEFPDQTLLGAMMQDLEPYQGVHPRDWGSVEAEGVFGRDPGDDSSATGTYLRNMLAQFGPALQESMERLPLGEQAWMLDEMVHEFATDAGVPWAAQLMIDVLTPGLEGAVLARMGRVPKVVDDSEIAEKAIATLDEAKAPPGETDMTRRGFLKATGAVAGAVVGLGGARAAKVAGKVASKAPRVIKELSKAALRAKDIPFIARRRSRLMDFPIRDLMELAMRRGMEDSVRPHAFVENARSADEVMWNRPGMPGVYDDVTGRAVSDDTGFDGDMRQLVAEMEAAGDELGIDPSAPDSKWTPESLNQHREEAARTVAAIDTDQAIDILRTMGYSDEDIDALIDHGATVTEIAFEEVDAWGDFGPGPHPGREASWNQMDDWISGLADHFEDPGNESFFQWTAAEHSVDDLVDADLYDLNPDSTPRNPQVRHGADEAHRPHFTEEDWKLEGDMRDATESWMHMEEAAPIPSRFDEDGMPAESPNPFPEGVRNEYEDTIRLVAEQDVARTPQEASARHEAAQPSKSLIDRAKDSKIFEGQGQIARPLIPIDEPVELIVDTYNDLTRRDVLVGGGVAAAGAAGAGALSRAAKRAGEAVKSIVKPAEVAAQAPRVLSRAAQAASNNQAVGAIRRNLMNETIEELFHKVMRKGVKRETRDSHTGYTRRDRTLANEGFDGDVDISSEEYWEAREWDGRTESMLEQDFSEYRHGKLGPDDSDNPKSTRETDTEWVRSVRWDKEPDNQHFVEALQELESDQARDILLEMGYDESALAMAEEAGVEWASEVSIDGPDDWVTFYDDVARTPLDLFDIDGAHADAGPWPASSSRMGLDEKLGDEHLREVEANRRVGADLLFDPDSTPANPHHSIYAESSRPGSPKADSKSFEEVGRPDPIFDEQGMPLRTPKEVREGQGWTEEWDLPDPDDPEGGLSRRDVLKGSGALAVTAATGGLSRGLSQVAGASTEIPITTVAKAAEDVPVSAVWSLADMTARQLSQRLSNMVYEGRWTDGSDESKGIIDELAMRGFDELEIDNHVAGLKVNRERAEESVGLAIDHGTPPGSSGEVLRPDPKKSPQEGGYYLDEDYEGWEDAVQEYLAEWGSDFEVDLEDDWEDSLRTIEDMEDRMDPRRGEYEDPEDDLSYSPLFIRPPGGLMYPQPTSPGAYSAYTA